MIFSATTFSVVYEDRESRWCDARQVGPNVSHDDYGQYLQLRSPSSGHDRYRESSEPRDFLTWTGEDSDG
ncbi:hypothetical protein NS277_02925 [Novosphingobium barchaimii]|nr:hypothetical protein NS277_02925 [Novosphingobium barchaimii]